MRPWLSALDFQKAETFRFDSEKMRLLVCGRLFAGSS
jgi:hypothetical protein